MAMEHCDTITEARGLLDFYRHFANATGRIIKVADGYLVMAFWGTR